MGELLVNIIADSHLSQTVPDSCQHWQKAELDHPVESLMMNEHIHVASFE